MKQFYKTLWPKHKKTDQLLEQVEAARQEWHLALQQINQITSTDMLDHIIFKIDSAERKFIALLKQAKEEGVLAWPEDLYKIRSIESASLPEEKATYSVD